MTIAKGEPWGREVPRPPDLKRAVDDAHLARTLSQHTGDPVAVESGDMFRTIGARPLDDRTEVMSLPIDLVHYEFDGRPGHFVSHLVVRLPSWRGGVWRGPLLVVMNAEWIGEFDVAPRGHPNDGRVETLLAAPELGARQRLAVRSRLRTGTHLPHPLITTRSIRSGEWTFDQKMVVFTDGQRVGRASQLSIRVEPDAAVLFA